MQENTFDAVIFDLDGVVIDTKVPIEDFWKKWGTHKGIAIDEKIMHEKIHGRPAHLTLNTIFAHLTETEKEEIKLAGEQMERDLTYSLMPGVKDFLQALVAHSIKTALVTSSLPEKVATVFQQLGLSGLFTKVVTADQIVHGKPAPDCYLLAAKKLQLPAQNCLVFEDSASGVKAAHDAGMTVIGVNDPIAVSLLKAEGAALVIPDFLQMKIKNEGDQRCILSLSNTNKFILCVDAPPTRFGPV
jgi:HAD superfamily hydrolase (TIGR01509 family)